MFIESHASETLPNFGGQFGWFRVIQEMEMLPFLASKEQTLKQQCIGILFSLRNTSMDSPKLGRYYWMPITELPFVSMHLKAV